MEPYVSLLVQSGERQVKWIFVSMVLFFQPTLTFGLHVKLEFAIRLESRQTHMTPTDERASVIDALGFCVELFFFQALNHCVLL